MELSMYDMDSDLLNFDGFFAPNDDEEVADLWNITGTTGHDEDLLDAVELEPLSPILKVVPTATENKHGLKLDTKLINSSNEEWLAHYDKTKANGTPTATLPARFALLSTTCVYEPGFTTSPRGKRRISQTHQEIVVISDQEESEESQEDEVDEPFLFAGDEDYSLPDFTDAELSTLVESSPLCSLNDAQPHSTPTMSPQDKEDELLDVNFLNSIYENSQNLFSPDQSTSQSIFSSSFDTTTISASNSATASIPLDYFSPSGYAANQFLDSYAQSQAFILNSTKSAMFHQPLPNSNAQLVAAMAMAKTSSIHKMNANYGMPIAPMQRILPSSAQIKVIAPIQPRLAIQRTASTSVVPTTTTSNAKVTRLAITPDIADFKLVQIFHQFCEPTIKVLTLPRFQQLLLHHQVKEDNSNTTNDSSDTCCGTLVGNVNVVITPDAQTLFQTLDINSVGTLDLERFMHSFQICNRCTEAKRRAHQALCASQGQKFTPTALERQLMEDVAPVVVRVVPTRFEGHKVKSCEHYQWTWCEGFEKTGNEKCRGTNRHDKCPKYLANCTLWKHKLPPKCRKPKVLLENVDSPTKKFKYFS